MKLTIPKLLLPRLFSKTPFRFYSTPESEFSSSMYIDKEDLYIIKTFLEAESDILHQDNIEPDYGDISSIELIEGSYLTLEMPSVDILDHQIATEIEETRFKLRVTNSEPHLCSKVFLNLARAKEQYMYDGDKVTYKHANNSLGRVMEGIFAIYDYESAPHLLKGYLDNCVSLLIQKQNKNDVKGAIVVWEHIINFARANESIMPLNDLELLLSAMIHGERYAVLYDLEFISRGYSKNYLYKLDLSIEDIVSFAKYITIVISLYPLRVFKLKGTFKKLVDKLVTSKNSFTVVINKLVGMEMDPLTRIVLIYYLTEIYRDYKSAKIVENFAQCIQITEDMLQTLPFSALIMLNKMRVKCSIGINHRFVFDLNRFIHKYLITTNSISDMSVFLNQIFQITFLSVKLTHETNGYLFEHFDYNFVKWLDFIDETIDNIKEQKIEFKIDEKINMVLKNTFFIIQSFILHFEVLMSTKTRIYSIYSRIRDDPILLALFSPDKSAFSNFSLVINGVLQTRLKSTPEEERKFFSVMKKTDFRSISDLLSNRRHFSLHLALRFEKKLMKDFMIYENQKIKLVIFKALMNMDHVIADHFEILNDYLNYVDLETLDMADLFAIFTKANPRIISRENLERLYEFLKQIYGIEAEMSMEKKLLIYKIEEDNQAMLAKEAKELFEQGKSVDR